MHTPLTPGMGDMLNPGYVAGGGYGNFVRNNIANRERYTLNYLTPASYKSHWLDFPLTISAPFFKSPPTFFNGRKPAWYAKYAQKKGAEAAEQRFQNGLVWADIPETEAAHPMYIQNTDGSYRLSSEGFRRKINSALVPDGTWVSIPESDIVVDGNKTITSDFFTDGRIGGAHSDFTKLAEQNGSKLMEFKDEQKLNPQWLITDPIKEQIGKHFSKDTKAYKFLDWLGGKPLDWLVGYKPFTIKQDYFHNGNNILPVFQDPINPYLPVPVRMSTTRVDR